MRTFTTALAITLLLPLAGCDAFKKAKDTFDGLTNPLVGLGFVIGVEAPESDLIDLSNSPWQVGTGLTAFLADASSVADLNNAPVSGAELTLVGNVAVDADESTSGLYTIDPGGDLAYTADEVWTVEVLATPDSELSTADLELPPGAEVSVPEQHNEGADIQLDFTGLGYDSALVVVLDPTGGVTWSNEPKGAKEVYDFTHGKDELTTLTVPGDEAFPGQAIYAVGVAPMIHTIDADLDNMNTGLSKFLAGKMKFYPVSTVPTR